MSLSALSFERFLNVRAAGGASFHPDGSRLAFITDITGVPQVWAVSTEGGWPDQLTFERDRVNFARYAPHGGHLVYGMDVGGNEQQQLYLLSPDGSHVRDLTQRPDALHYWGSWSPDGRSIAFAANRRDPRFFDIYLGEIDTGAIRCVYESDATVYAGSFAPDGQRLVLLRTNASLDMDLLLLDLATGDTRHLTPHQGKAIYGGVSWEADGRRLVLVTDQGRNTPGLARLDLATLDLTWLDAGEWDVEDLALSPNRRLAAYTVNVDGWSELRLLDLATGERLPTPAGLPQGVISVLPICRDPRADSPLAWSPDGRLLAVSRSSSTQPANVWLVEIGGAARPVTHSSLAGIPAQSLVTPTLVHYESFDGRRIPAFYYTPREDPHPDPLSEGEGERTRPVLVLVHGGPEGQSRPAFGPTGGAVIAYFVNRGYAVFAPNVRGSTGYGREYTHLDDVEKRMDSVADLAYGVRWLTGEGGADPRRIAVMGASYGGFMALAAVTEYPDLWAAGIDIVGIGNFVTFLERTGAYRRKHRESEYGSLEQHRDVLERISPIHKVDRITAPLLVIHGANDPRVPVHEAEQMVAALKARHHPVEYLRFEDEGHGIVKLANRLVAYPAIAAFLDRYLG